MYLILSFLIFIASLIGCLIGGITMVVPLTLGMFLFAFCAVKKGYTIKAVGKMALSSVRESMLVIRILLLIGCMTGLWRMSGTIAYFVDMGVKLVPGSFFILAAFLIPAAMSYCLGTSYGVAATAGVIMMAIARASDANLVITAGAVMSGLYVGDRGSSAASSGNLVASLTHTDMRDNVRVMAKTAFWPFLTCVLIYGGLSFLYPSFSTSVELLGKLEEIFTFSIWCLLPAILMIILPLLRMPIMYSMMVSILVSGLLSVFLQGQTVLETLRVMVFGYRAGDRALEAVLNGGGLVSMLEVAVILLVSGTYGGIFKESGLLDNFNEILLKAKDRLGRYPVMVILSTAVCAIFCNQTIGAIMVSALSQGLYGDSSEECQNKMIDMEDSVIVIAGLIPWNIAASVPLAMIGGSMASLALASYLYLIPLCRLVGQIRAKGLS